MSRYDYTRYPPPLPMGLMRHLSHPKPLHKLRLVMPNPQIAKDAIDQIRLDVEFSESQSRPGGPEVAVMTSINALKLLLLEIDTLRKDKARLDFIDNNGAEHDVVFERNDPEVGVPPVWQVWEAHRERRDMKMLSYEQTARAAIDAAMQQEAKS